MNIDSQIKYNCNFCGELLSSYAASYHMCGPMEKSKKMKEMYIHNVVTLEAHPDKCTGCGICIEVCPREVLRMSDRKVSIIDRDACIECGACSRNCSFEAITVRAGVGCAYAVLYGKLRGTEPQCGFSEDDCC